MGILLEYILVVVATLAVAVASTSGAVSCSVNASTSQATSWRAPRNEICFFIPELTEADEDLYSSASRSTYTDMNGGSDSALDLSIRT